MDQNNKLQFYNFEQLSENSVLIEFSTNITKNQSILLNELSKKLVKLFQTQLVEIIPSHNSLYIEYKPLLIKTQLIKETSIKLLSNLKSKDNKIRKHRIPVCYDRRLTTDIEEISKVLKIPTCEIIKLHLSQNYFVSALGFMPGFAYLYGLNTKLNIPRKSTPARQVYPGSVGIANDFTAIYPSFSPGGWYIIGLTPFKIKSILDDKNSFFQVGDEINFYQIPYKEYKY
ncbi:hypothetical protein CF386_10445 [Paraphotobacterium marinum]|uniref:Carboxyltransferase domain-containing protein n=1 Tax=Paraphotobacterium marinum TaxID=1755811 RepID=A0A220VGT9_9GAMM|nr:carboxyltransferase domain-containing protein [Paraphotobacterium marinum]ASK79470.1 hypothetical protein CF386_10445 [Paraphotobacterium marinum]